MTGTLIFLVLGLMLLGILLAIALYGDQSERSLESDREPGAASPAIFTDLELHCPSRLLANRIFAQGDLDFVSREAPLLERTFLQERKKVALLWLKDTRFCMSRMFRFYRMAVRNNPALEFRTELKIASYYVLLICMFSSVQVLINLLGPFRVRGMIIRIFGLADGISMGVGRILEALDRASLVKTRDDLVQQSGLDD